MSSRLCSPETEMFGKARSEDATARRMSHGEWTLSRECGKVSPVHEIMYVML